MSRLTTLSLSILILASSAVGSAMAQNNNPPQGNSMGPVINNQGIVTQGQIGNNTIVNPVVREPDGIYQGTKKVGRARQPTIDRANGVISFGALSFNDFPDPNSPLEFGDVLFECKDMPRQQPNTFVGTLSAMVVGAQCKIVGSK